MKINELMNNAGITVSYEVFPPKKAEGLTNVKEVAGKIASLNPPFMSVTYGAAGTTAAYTLEIADEIKHTYGVTVLPHLTCVSSTYESVDRMLELFEEKEIKNIMVLRGDMPLDGHKETDFEHASDLIRYIKSKSDLCVGAACYPEGHIESANREDDLVHLKEKVDAGADFLTTQMFFDNNIFYSFLYRAREKGIQVPICAGIMPITNAKQLARSVSLSGTEVPARFRAIVDRFGSDPAAMKQAGIIYASEQIVDLIANGITHIHVYSMNKPEVAEGIFRNISELII